MVAGRQGVAWQGSWRLALLLLVGAVAYLPANAERVSGITVDGSLSDWGVTTPVGSGNHANSTWTSSQGVWTAEDYVGSGGYVGPGYGGQSFDVEALYSGFDTSTNTLYVALVTGFTIDGFLHPLYSGVYQPYQTYGGVHYFPGDLFIDFGVQSTDPNPHDQSSTNHSWDLALDLNTLSSQPTSATDFQTQLQALQIQSITNTPSETAGYDISGPYTATGTSAGSADFAYLANGAGTDHNVYEFSYQVTNCDWLNQIYQPGAGYTVHWTTNCGNDYLDLPVAAVAPLPNAASLGLLGCAGLLGTGFLKKRIHRHNH